MYKNDFDVNDALLVGGAAGLINYLLEEDEYAENDCITVDEDEDVEPSDRNLQETKRLDPALYNMVLGAVQDQNKRIKIKKEKEAYAKAAEEIMEEAVVFDNMKW